MRYAAEKPPPEAGLAEAGVARRSDRLGVAAFVAATIGFVDSVYLTWLKLSGGTAACAGIGDCELVNNSRYSMVGGVPIALVGATAYASILALLFLARARPEWTLGIRLALFGLTLAGTLYSAYLTLLELAVLRAVCPFCVLSAGAMTLLFLLSLVRLRESV
jgi:uncharacterized membrane protein